MSILMKWVFIFTVFIVLISFLLIFFYFLFSFVKDLFDKKNDRESSFATIVLLSILIVFSVDLCFSFFTYVKGIL